MSVYAVLALITCGISFLGFVGASVYCFIGQVKLIGVGAFCGILGLFYGFILVLVIKLVVGW